MKIAVPYNNGMIFQHFGHTKQFKIYEIADKKIISEEIIDTNGIGHSMLVNLLVSKGIDSFICGGIGGCARTGFAENNIQLFPGVEGEADKAVKDFLSDNLKYDLNKICSHHDHNHNCSHHNQI